MPDLAMKTASGILLIAEIKPAVVPCLIDGEEQELGYIDQGNANDPAQVAWRGQLGVTVVAPMREQNYNPPTLSLAGGLELEAAWCSDGLMGYSIYKKGQKKKIEHPVPVGEKATDEQKEQIRQRLPQIPDWVLVLITAALAVAIIACFASGACEAAGIIAAIGEAAGWILINAMRLAGIAFAASAAAR
jgi:hypothetical protein